MPFLRSVGCLADDPTSSTQRAHTLPQHLPRSSKPEVLKVEAAIHATPASLPTAHTCFNTLCLPLYASEQQLADKLDVALSHDSGFGLA